MQYGVRTSWSKLFWLLNCDRADYVKKFYCFANVIELPSNPQLLSNLQTDGLSLDSIANALVLKVLR